MSTREERLAEYEKIKAIYLAISPLEKSDKRTLSYTFGRALAYWVAGVDEKIARDFEVGFNSGEELAKGGKS